MVWPDWGMRSYRRFSLLLVDSCVEQGEWTVLIVQGLGTTLGIFHIEATAINGAGSELTPAKG
jgi:hypothetical protein